MTLARDLMVRDVITVPPNASVADLIHRLDESTISGVPVVDEQETLVGVVSARDVLRLARELSDVPEAMRWGLAVSGPPKETGLIDAPIEGEFFAYYVTPGGEFVDVRDRIRDVPTDSFSGYKVEDIMSPVPLTIHADATVQEVARFLHDHRIHRVLVVDSGRFVGIITTTDLLSEIAGS